MYNIDMRCVCGSVFKVDDIPESERYNIADARKNWEQKHYGCQELDRRDREAKLMTPTAGGGNDSDNVK